MSLARGPLRGEGAAEEGVERRRGRAVHDAGEIRGARGAELGGDAHRHPAPGPVHVVLQQRGAEGLANNTRRALLFVLESCQF